MEDFRSSVVNKDKAKRKNKELQAEAGLTKKQYRTREQCVGLIGEEFTKKWEALPPDMKFIFEGFSKDDFAKHTSALKSFNVGYTSKSPMKSHHQQ